jgi:hypothetical protein
VDNGLHGIQLATSAADSDIQQQALVTVTGALRPVPRDVLAFASGGVHTRRGEVRVWWRRLTGGRVALSVDVPVNVRARVTIPQAPGWRYVGAGEGAPRRLGVERGREVFEVGSGRTSFAAERR